jgi:hypothetical protein
LRYAILAQAVLNAGRGTMVVPAIQSDPLLLALILPCTLHQRLEAEMTFRMRTYAVSTSQCVVIAKF